MTSDDKIRSFAHQLVDRMTPERLNALLDLLDEDFFTDEEVKEIHQARTSHDWTDWRLIRDDL